MLRRTHVLGVSALLAVALGVGLTRAGAGPVADKEALSVPRRAVVIAAGDATLRDGSANQNQGAESLLRIRSSGRNRALVRFNATDLAEVLAGTTLVSAHLELKVKTNGGNWGAGQTVDAHRLTSSWSEGAVTWNCPTDTNLGNQAADCAAPWNGGTFAPAATASVLHTNALSGWVRFEVTADLEAAMAGAPFFGWLLKKTNEGTSGLVEYAAREVCGEEPRLVLELAAPAADTTPPRLTITSPAERFLVRQPASLTLSFFDAGTEIAPASLAVTLDGANLTATCSVCGATASCPAPLLAEGAHTLITSLRDTAGNLATARHDFDLLLGDGEHRVTLAAVADTHLRSGSPNQNEGADTLLRLRASGKNRALVRFDLAAVAGLVEALQSATLELTITTNGNNWGTGRTVDAHAVSAPWSELGATWNCASDTNPTNSQPDCTPQWNGGTFASTATSSVTITNGLGGTVAFDVTADVMAALLSGEHHGWLLKKTFETQNGLIEFSSREGAAGPRLVLTFDGGEPVDATPPLLAITAPTAGEELDTALPSLAFAMSDDASGVNTASLAVAIDGAPVTVSCTFTPSAAICSLAEPLADGPHTLTATIADHAGNTSSPASVTFTIDTRPPPDPSLPPDPASVAPPLDRTVVTDVAVATEFLYTGEHPIQTGVAPGTIEPHRVAVVRGRVLDRDGLPLPGVLITLLDHPEFGSTKSRADGAFDLAINGGGLVTLEYAKPGYLPLQRQVETPWKDYVPVEDVVMLPLDPEATTITAGAPVLQVARGSAATDADGTRRATLLFPAGTTAVMELPDGSAVGLPSLTVRATEYTVGERGREAMPGPLPPTVAYTYAVELSADEAIAAGAEKVTFSQPVSLYVENFLGFDVGSVVPVGSYDRREAAWMAEENGLVLEIVAIDASGRATLDLAGNGTAASAAELAALGITDAERLELARLYPAGQSLWRVAISHFTPFDCNWPYAPPDDAIPPPDDEETPDEGNGDEEEPDCTEGSIIECQNQTLRERVALVGTPFELAYASDRTLGRFSAYEVPIRVTGATVPASLVRAEIEVSIAGQREKRSFLPSANQFYTFVWDGKDAYGRRVQGAVELSVKKSYIYDLRFSRGAANARAWARVESGGGFSDPPRRLTGGLVLNRQRVRSLDVGVRTTLGSFDAKALGLGAWMLSAHHVFDPVAEKLYLGSGLRRSARGIAPGIDRSAGAGEFGYDGDGGPAELALLSQAADFAVGSDGTVFIADKDNNVIRRVGRDGIINTVAGTGAACEWVDETTPPDCGEGVPATAALLNAPEGVAVNAAGELLIADTGDDCVRKVGQDGNIHTLAGFCNGGGPPLKSHAAKALIGCDDCSGTSAELGAPRGLAPSPEGGLFLGDSEQGRIRYLTPDGRLYTVAGGGEPADELGDGGIATAARLVNPAGIALAADGSLYIAEPARNRIRVVSRAGRISTFAGTGEASFCGDGGPAVSACLSFPRDVALSPDGSVWIADTGNHLLRRVGPNGKIDTRAGTRAPGGAPTSEQGSAAESVELGDLSGLAAAPNDAILIGTGSEVLRLAATLERELSSEVLIPSPDGGEVYVFDRAGRHLRTVDASTGVTTLSFTYSAAGLVTEIRDRDGNLTTLNRTASGEVSEIIGPFGQVTALDISAGLLATLTNPAGEATTFTYTPAGLLETMTDPRGGVRRYTYNTLGGLVAARDPLLGTKVLSRTNLSDKTYDITLLSPLGRVTRYTVEDRRDGSGVRTRREASGAESEVRDDRDGSRTMTSPDDSQAIIHRRPDPRWRLAAPLPGTVEVKTPAGLAANLSSSRGVVLADPSDPLSLAASIDRVTINGRLSTRAYDAATRTVTETSAEGRTRTTVLDAKGRPVTVAVPGIAALEMSYDPRGRLATVAQGTGPERREMSFSYDAAGTLATVTDPLGRSASLTHDAAGRVTAMALPGGRTVSLTYDANGNPTSVAPPGKPAHTFAFDGLDQVTSYQAPAVGAEASTTANTYNADRQPTEVALPNGESLSFGYDTAGRLASATTPEGTYSFAYVPQTDKLATATAPGGVTLSTSYDGPLVTGATWSGPVVGAVAARYNANFELAEQTVNGSYATTYAYDRDGLLLRAGALNFAVNAANGQPMGSELGLVSDSVSFSPLGHVAGYAAAVGSAPLFDLSFVRDPSGQIVEKRETIGGVSSTYTYSYDAAGRLAEVRKDGVAFESYAYDLNSNRTSWSDPWGGETATFDAQDRLTSTGTRVFTNSANGERLASTSGGMTTTFDYSSSSQLVRVDLPSSISIEYVLDPLDRRIGKKVNGELTQRLLYAGMVPVAEVDADGAVITHFVYGRKSNVPEYFTRNRDAYRLITDHLGSVRLVVNAATGAIAQRLDYSAFGRVLLDTNPGFQPFGFAGGLYDHQTGLVHFGARDYDPTTGRWLTKDPELFGGGGENLFAYALNDPLNAVDSDGLAVGEPGVLEGFIPIWGSGRAAINDFQCGRWGWGLVNSALAISDVALVKSLLQAAGKGLWKSGSHAWRATRQWYGRTRGLAANTPVHHWAIEQNSAIGRRIPEAIKNQPWNLNPMPSRPFHDSVHGIGRRPFDPLQRWWHGTPGWAKNAEIGLAGDTVNAATGGDCECGD